MICSQFWYSYGALLLILEITRILEYLSTHPYDMLRERQTPSKDFQDPLTIDFLLLGIPTIQSRVYKLHSLGSLAIIFSLHNQVDLAVAAAEVQTQVVQNQEA